MRPAQPHQVVQQRMRQITILAVLHHAHGAVALGQFLPVRPQDHRQVREARHRRAERFVQIDLARRVVDMIVATDDLGDAHVDVVDHHREVVGGEPVRTQHHEIVEFGVGPLHPALDLVLEHHAAGFRIPETQHAVGIVAVRQVLVARAAVVARFLAAVLQRGPHRVEFVLRFVGPVGLAGIVQRLRHLAVAFHPPGLVERAFVRVEAQPVHAVQDRPHRRIGGTLAIGVLDAQDELAAAMARFQPAVQRGARSADVQESGGTGREAGTERHGEAMSWKRESLADRAGRPVAAPP